MRFRGLRRGGDHVPSRSFQALQRMTGDADGAPYSPQPQQPYHPQQQQHPLQQQQHYSPQQQYHQQQQPPYVQQQQHQPYLQQRSQPNNYGNPAQYMNKKPQQNQYQPAEQQYQYAQPQFRQQPSFDHNQAHQEEEGETPVDIRYTGGSIPSRSFRILQEMTGEDPGSEKIDFLIFFRLYVLFYER